MQQDTWDILFLVLVTQLLNSHNPTSLLAALLRNNPCKLHCAWTYLSPLYPLVQGPASPVPECSLMAQAGQAQHLWVGWCLAPEGLNGWPRQRGSFLTAGL